MGVSPQWEVLEKLLAKAWRLILFGTLEVQPGAAAASAPGARASATTEGGKREAVATGPAKALVDNDAAVSVLLRWIDAWSRCADPASVWSDHRRTWLATRGLALLALPLATQNERGSERTVSESTFGSERPRAAAIRLGWPSDGPDVRLPPSNKRANATGANAGVNAAVPGGAADASTTLIETVRVACIPAIRF